MSSKMPPKIVGKGKTENLEKKSEKKGDAKPSEKKDVAKLSEKKADAKLSEKKDEAKLSEKKDEAKLSEKKADAKPSKQAAEKKSQKTSTSVPVISGSKTSTSKATKESPSTKSMPTIPPRTASYIAPTSKLSKPSNTQINTAKSGSLATSTPKPAGKAPNVKTDSSISAVKKNPSIKEVKNQFKPSVTKTTQKESKPSAKPVVAISHKPTKTDKPLKSILKTKKSVGSSQGKTKLESTIKTAMKVLEKQLVKPKKGVSLKQQKGSGEAQAFKKALAVQKKVRKFKIVPKCKP